MSWLKNLGKQMGKNAVQSAKMTAVMTAEQELQSLLDTPLTASELEHIAKVERLCIKIRLKHAK